MPKSRNILSLLSDFGLSDTYVGELKFAALRVAPRIRIVDITHSIPRHDVLAGSLALERAVAAAERGTVHAAIVDPGVGSDRRLIIVEVQGQKIVCPDNGLVTWAVCRHGCRRAWELSWRPDGFSNTFHGRDVIVPAAARLAWGGSLRQVAREIDNPLLLRVRPVDAFTAPSGRGEIVHFDHFGNATTNLVMDRSRGVNAGIEVRLARKSVGPLRRTYADVSKGQPLALVGSGSLLEIAVRDGSARDALGLRVGAVVTIQRSRAQGNAVRGKRRRQGVS